MARAQQYSAIGAGHGGVGMSGQNARLDQLAHDFAPDLLTLQESPPSRLPRSLVLGVTALVGATVAWGAWAKLDMVATAQGRLVPMSFIKVVQPAEPGVVTDILVKDGDTVKAGQVLLRLDARLSQSDLAAQGHDVTIKRLALKRIEAELADQAFVPPIAAPASLVAQVQAQYLARRLAYTDALAQEAQALNKATAELKAAEQVLRKLRETVPIYEQTANAHEKLRLEGFVGEVAAAEKRRDYVERAQDLKAQESTVDSLQSVMAQSHQRTAGIRSTYKSQLENERMEVLAQLNKSTQELDKSSIRAGLLEIKAPTDGIVKDLGVTTSGAVVQAGALLMNLVPKDEPVQAEVLLANEDVGFVAVGQAARVKIAAYPFQKYGLLEGTVTHLGADVTDPKSSSFTAQQNGQQPTLAYRALVRLDEQVLVSPSGERLALNPGMVAIAEVHQGRRTVLEYLLSPVRKVAQEAARER